MRIQKAVLPVRNNDENSALRLCAPAQWSASDFSRVYANHFQSLVFLARRSIKDSSLAEDIVHEAFLYLMLGIQDVETDEDAIRILTWKTKNLCIDYLRRSSGKKLVPIDDYTFLDDGSDELSKHLEDAVDSALVLQALSKLQPRHREILVENIFNEKSISEIAKSGRLTENSARQLLHRAKNAFKKIFLSELEAQGLTVSDVLSGAVKKISRSAVKASSVIAAIVLTMALSLGNSPKTVQSVPNLETVTEKAPIETPVKTKTNQVKPANKIKKTAKEPKVELKAQIAYLDLDAFLVSAGNTFEIITENEANTFVRFTYSEGSISDFELIRKEQQGEVTYFSDELNVENQGDGVVRIAGSASNAVNSKNSVIDGELITGLPFEITFELPKDPSTAPKAKITFGENRNKSNS